MSHVKVLLLRGKKIHSVWSVWGGLGERGIPSTGERNKDGIKRFIKLH